MHLAGNMKMNAEIIPSKAGETLEALYLYLYYELFGIMYLAYYMFCFLAMNEILAFMGPIVH